MSDKKKLYVGNIPWGVEEHELRERFEQFGTVYSIHMPTDRETGKFRGFAFIEMDEADANNAAKALHESDFGGRTIVVNEARPKQRQSSGGNRDRGDKNPYDRDGGNR